MARREYIAKLDPTVIGWLNVIKNIFNGAEVAGATFLNLSAGNIFGSDYDSSIEK